MKYYIGDPVWISMLSFGYIGPADIIDTVSCCANNEKDEIRNYLVQLPINLFVENGIHFHGVGSRSTKESIFKILEEEVLYEL
mgnify:FL=1